MGVSASVRCRSRMALPRRSAPCSSQLQQSPPEIAYLSAALDDHEATRIRERPLRALIPVIESVVIVVPFNWKVSDSPYVAPRSSRLRYTRLTRPHRPSSSWPTTSGGHITARPAKV